MRGNLKTSRCLAWAALAAAWMLAACGPAGLTGIDLHIHSVDPDELEWLEVTVSRDGGEQIGSPQRRPDDERPVESIETVLILLPEAFEEETVLIRVLGFSGGEPASEGQTQVVVEAGVLQEAEVIVAPRGYCDTDEDCDAGEVCSPDGWCAPGCRIEGVFFEPGEANPINDCEECRPEVSTTGWTYSDAGTPCGEEMVCDGSGRCVSDEADLVPLLVERGGLGSGMVYSDPEGIDCGDACSALFEVGSTVTLTAVADEDSEFDKWRGDVCEGSEPTCTFTIDDLLVVTARFDVKMHELQVSTTGTGAGTVVSTDGLIKCGVDGDDCTAFYDHERSVTLERSVREGSEFVGWGGACSGGYGRCELSMTEDAQVNAEFALKEYELSMEVLGGGEGRITSEDGLIDCWAGGGSCEVLYGHGQTVVLTRTEEEGSSFLGWGGACESAGATCELTMTKNYQVTARFERDVHDLTVSVGGTGAGSVISTDNKIDCGSGEECVAQYEHGDQVRLERVSASGSRFVRWGGACSGDGVRCDLVIAGGTSVSADFNVRSYELDVGVLGNGVGRVTSADGKIHCGDGETACSAVYDHGQTVALSHEASSHSSFGGWGGVCGGSGPTCELTMTANRSATARFDLNSYEVSITLNGTGEGNVSSSGGQINCGTEGDDCEAVYTYGQMVSLSASPSAASELAGWGGACAGATGSSCVFEVSGEHEVTAEFNRFTYMLEVELLGTGVGAVKSGDEFIECGSGKEDCEAVYEHGSSVTLFMETGDCTDFVGWGGDCFGNEHECTLTMTGNRSVTGEIAVKTYSLSFTAEGSGAGGVAITPPGLFCEVECDLDYQHGEVVTLERQIGDNSEFGGWGGDCSGDSAVCQVTMTENRDVTARFDLHSYVLTVDTGGNGEGSVVTNDDVIDCGYQTDKCTAVFEHGESVVLYRLFASSSVFSGWEGDCDSAGPESCVVNFYDDRSVTGNFTLRQEWLEVKMAGTGFGTVESEPAGIDCDETCEASFEHYTEVTLTADADDDSDFLGWLGEGCSGTGTCTVTMTGARSVTAVFNLKNHPLTVYMDGNGEGSVEMAAGGDVIHCDDPPCEEIYQHYTEVILSAEPESDSDFAGWSGGGCSGTDPCTVEMTQAYEVTATFNLKTHPLVVENDANGSGTVTLTCDDDVVECEPPCEEFYEHYTTVTLEASAHLDSEFLGWDGEGCSGTGTCVVTMTQARQVTASFKLKTYPLTVSKDGSGGGTVTSNPAGIHCGDVCSYEYDHHTQVTLTAHEADDSTFIGWSGAGCSGTGTCVVTMTQARQVNATFEIKKHSLTVSKSGTGEGVVTSSPSGIHCGDVCSYEYDHYTEVTLTAHEAVDSTFLGWSGEGCSGTGTCVVTMTQARQVTAEFHFIEDEDP